MRRAPRASRKTSSLRRSSRSCRQVPSHRGVVGEVEDVIGLVVGQVDLEQVQAPVDGVDEAELAGQGVDGADAAVGDAAARSAIS